MRGLFFGIAIGLFITGVIRLMNVYCSLPFFIIGVVLIAVFVNPKSRIRQYIYSVSDKLGIGFLPSNYLLVVNHENSLSIYVVLRTVSAIQVNRIDLHILHIKRKKISANNWEPRKIQGDEQQYIHFTRPSWLHKGNYRGYLKAYTPEGHTKSDNFEIEVVFDF